MYHAYVFPTRMTMHTFSRRLSVGATHSRTSRTLGLLSAVIHVLHEDWHVCSSRKFVIVLFYAGVCQLYSIVVAVPAWRRHGNELAAVPSICVLVSIGVLRSIMVKRIVLFDVDGTLTVPRKVSCQNDHLFHVHVTCNRGVNYPGYTLQTALCVACRRHQRVSISFWKI